MSIQNLEEDLSQLEVDANQREKHSGILVEGLATRARIAEEDMIAAEFIATEETLEGLGSLLGLLQQLADIRKQQFEFFVDDGHATLSAMQTAETPGDYLHFAFEHFLRRTDHVGECIKDCVDVISNQTTNLTNSLFSLWSPFFKFARRDWSGN